MRLALAVLFLVLLVMATLLRSHSARIRELELTVKQLDSKVDEKGTTSSLELQAKCSEQARKFFSDMGFAKNDMAGFENHYNSQMNKCFVQVSSSKAFKTDAKKSSSTLWTYRNVFDAFEGKEYGSFAWHDKEGKKYWEIPPFQCEVTLPSGEKKFCHSDDEFTDLVKVYMQGGH
jgi:hypothetical protein